jgi:DNA-directed RNA polymerase subunit L
MARVQIYVEIVTDDPKAAIQKAYDEIPEQWTIVGQGIDGEAVDEEGDSLWR